MHRFLVGDELGNIKSIDYVHDTPPEVPKTEVRTLHTGPSAVQALAFGTSSEGTRLVTAGFSNGASSAFSLGNDGTLEELHRWKEIRSKPEHRYVGLTISTRGTFSCTSNGALRLTTHDPETQSSAFQFSALPTRLHAWRMSQNQETFSYGGDEVDISVWDTECAFISRSENSEPASKKRKRDALFPGELWRGRNVQNDYLGLRQPLRITSLAYITSSLASNHLVTGTDIGHIHRYDTRAARRPVFDWKISKTGGVRTIEKGLHEHELFVGDNANNLCALDLRNGRVVYSYQGLSGAVTSLAPSKSSILASTALDRYVRIHSTQSPPDQVELLPWQKKAAVIEKVYMKSTPTVVVWDQSAKNTTDVAVDDADDVWATMETTGDDGSRKKGRF